MSIKAMIPLVPIVPIIAVVRRMFWRTPTVQLLIGCEYLSIGIKSNHNAVNEKQKKTRSTWRVFLIGTAKRWVNPQMHALAHSQQVRPCVAILLDQNHLE